MNLQEIQDLLNGNRDEGYAQFQRKLIPNIAPETVLGVRTPVLRKLAKQIAKEDVCKAFLEELPHRFFEENQLHGFLISDMRDYDACIRELEKFLPYMDNWATCDQTSPAVFAKHRKELLAQIQRWLNSDHPYTVRFGIGMLMRHYLDEDFQPEYLTWVTQIKSEEYYVNMEIAWYLATALAKQWNAAISCLESKKMEKWVHNKTIRKAIESYRITDEQKAYLRSLKQ
jgi:3-methyladenine DNA glycosylase AlkD